MKHEMNLPSLPAPTVSRRIIALIGWLILCLGASGIAFFVSTEGWYAALRKPSWNPPPWLFGPVWTLLYVMMAVAAWLVWREGGWKRQSRPRGWFIFQWFLNLLWTPLFFGMHRAGLAFIDIVLLWGAIAGTVMLFWRVRKAAGALLVPYLIWVTFAATLNFTIWSINR
jgi:tryptophan-rich sensory protein